MPRNFCPTRRVWMRPWRASFLPEHRRGSQWSKSYHLHQLICTICPAYNHCSHSPTSPPEPRYPPFLLRVPEQRLHEDRIVEKYWGNEPCSVLLPLSLPSVSPSTALSGRSSPPMGEWGRWPSNRLWPFPLCAWPPLTIAARPPRLPRPPGLGMAYGYPLDE